VTSSPFFTVISFGLNEKRCAVIETVFGVPSPAAARGESAIAQKKSVLKQDVTFISVSLSFNEFVF
jgi:hypothetical protein